MMDPEDEAEIAQLSAASGMPIPNEYRPGVLQQWRLNQRLAEPLLAFDLPEAILPAPLFRP